MDFNKVIAFIREHHLSSGFIPLHAPVFNGREKEYLLETIDSTFVSSVGAFVDRFEEQMAAITATKRAVATVNGTAALQVALQLAGVQRSDEVITQALTFVATANAIAYNGAEPIFLDVDFDTMGLSPQAVAAFLEEYGDLREGGCYNKRSGRRLAACMPMHTFGFPVHIEELIRICRQWRIPVVEDAAEALGSLYKGKPCGSFGQMGTFSFNGNKIVTCGGGGAIVTQEDELGNQAKHLTTTAKAPHQWEYAHDALGYNFRMPNVNAALACAQLEQLEGFLENKRSTAHAYRDYFTKTGIRFKEEPKNTRSNYWLMCVELENRPERDRFLQTTNAQGVMTRPIWRLMYRLPMYEKCYRDEQRNAEYLEERIVNIPSSVRISE